MENHIGEMAICPAYPHADSMQKILRRRGPKGANFGKILKLEGAVRSGEAALRWSTLRRSAVRGRSAPRNLLARAFRVEHDLIVFPEPLQKQARLILTDRSPGASQDLVRASIAVDRREDALLLGLDE